MGCIEQKKSPAADSNGRDYNPFEVMEPRLPEKTPIDRRNGRPVKANDIPPEGVYLPNNNFLAPHMKSPEYVQLSNAAAITLGIMGGRMYGCECTRCLNLLLTYPEGCRANCAYCGLARHREAERDYADRNFIRVDWPAVPMADIVDIVARDPEGSPFHRMCISMITHPRSEEDTFAVLEQWTDRIDPDAIPVSILSNPTTMTRDDVQRCKDLGADIFTVALDAATPEIFDRTRGKGVQSPHKWKKYWDTLLEAKDIFGPGKFGAHIIVGMGETEYEVLTLVQELVDLGGHSHMFCFFPEEGSLMDHLPATPRDQWRRVQLARYLIDYRDVRVEQMKSEAAGKGFGSVKAMNDLMRKSSKSASLIELSRVPEFVEVATDGRTRRLTEMTKEEMVRFNNAVAQALINAEDSHYLDIVSAYDPSIWSKFRPQEGFYSELGEFGLDIVYHMLNDGTVFAGRYKETMNAWYNEQAAKWPEIAAKGGGATLFQRGMISLRKFPVVRELPSITRRIDEMAGSFMSDAQKAQFMEFKTLWGNRLSTRIEAEKLTYDGSDIGRRASREYGTEEFTQALAESNDAGIVSPEFVENEFQAFKNETTIQLEPIVEYHIRLHREMFDRMFRDGFSARPYYVEYGPEFGTAETSRVKGMGVDLTDEAAAPTGLEAPTFFADLPKTDAFRPFREGDPVKLLNIYIQYGSMKKFMAPAVKVANERLSRLTRAAGKRAPEIQPVVDLVRQSYFDRIGMVSQAEKANLRTVANSIRRAMPWIKSPDDMAVFAGQVKSLYATNAFLGNPSTVIRNLTEMHTTWSTLGTKDTAYGIMQAVKFITSPELQKKYMDNAVLSFRSGMIERGSVPGKWRTRLDNATYVGIQAVDGLTRVATYEGAQAKFVRLTQRYLRGEISLKKLERGLGVGALSKSRQKLIRKGIELLKRSGKLDIETRKAISANPAHLFAEGMVEITSAAMGGGKQALATRGPLSSVVFHMQSWMLNWWETQRKFFGNKKRGEAFNRDGMTAGMRYYLGWLALMYGAGEMGFSIDQMFSIGNVHFGGDEEKGIASRRLPIGLAPGRASLGPLATDLFEVVKLGGLTMRDPSQGQIAMSRALKDFGWLTGSLLMPLSGAMRRTAKAWTLHKDQTVRTDLIGNLWAMASGGEPTGRVIRRLSPEAKKRAVLSAVMGVDMVETREERVAEKFMRESSEHVVTSRRDAMDKYWDAVIAGNIPAMNTAMAALEEMRRYNKNGQILTKKIIRELDSYRDEEYIKDTFVRSMDRAGAEARAKGFGTMIESFIARERIQNSDNARRFFQSIGPDASWEFMKEFMLSPVRERDVEMRNRAFMKAVKGTTGVGE